MILVTRNHVPKMLRSEKQIKHIENVLAHQKQNYCIEKVQMRLKQII